MAVTLKRKRGAVSYREPSSDEDLSESSDITHASRTGRAGPPRRSTRQQHRPVDSTAPLPDTPARKHHPSSRANRSRGGPSISYKDVSSDDEDAEVDADFELSVERATTTRARQPRPSGRVPSPRSQKRQKSKGKPRTQPAFGAALKPNHAIAGEPKTPEIPTDGHKPDWTSLPYHVLLQIFVYASHPLHDENMKPTTSIGWLVRMARTCSLFTKPALTALYRNPPIFAIRHTRKHLVSHLSTPPPEGCDDHRVMVKRLEIDATQMSALTDATHSASDLGALVKSLTTLKEIDIFDPVDRPPFRGRLRRVRRWIYPQELFKALRQTELRLRSWRWNHAFCDQGILWIKEIHGDAAFQSLRELTLTKFHPEALSKAQSEDDQGSPTTEELLGSALQVLPNLRTLSFETCGVVNERLLPLLPRGLRSLSITNCGELLSETLQAFLATYGSYLEELVLDHNQALDLSFLIDLRSSCPKLEVLRMDTTYYSSLGWSRANEPLYTSLLGENEVPTWPSSLRVIEMEYLRHWNAATATNFFRSLIDAAESLPFLQEITIMAIVDTDWRQRAEFRRKWSAKFKQVFARKWQPPSAHLASLRAFREHQERTTDGAKDGSLAAECSGVVVSQAAVSEAPHDGDSDKDNEVPQLASWGSKRLRSRSKAATSYDEASENDFGSGEATSEDEGAPFIQGRCHSVLFRVDNFRPREEIYAEADFLDAEPSGDEEWNGNEVNDDEGGYAW